MRKIFNTIIANRLKAIVVAMLIIVLSVLAVGCGKQNNISYKVELTVSGYSPENGAFQTSLSKNNSKYECTVSMFDYFKCTTSVNVYQYNNNELLTGRPVFKANITQMKNILGAECASYNIYKEDDLVKEVNFRFDDFHLTGREVDNGSFMLEREVGTHKLKFDIPELKQYATQKISFEIVLNVVEDARTKSSEIYFSDDQNKRAPDETINGVDFYIVNEQPTFVVKDSDSGEYLIGNDGGTMFCGGELYVAYRKLDDSYFSNDIVYSVGEGLYLCNVSFLNSDEYRSNSYQCYILYKG